MSIYGLKLSKREVRHSLTPKLKNQFESWQIILITLATGAIIVIVIGLMYLWYRWRLSAAFQIQRQLIDTSELNFVRRLGEGAFGEVIC